MPRGRIGCRASPLNPDPLDFVEVDGVAGAVVKLGRLGRLVEGDGLGLLRGPVILHPLSAAIQPLETRVISSSGPLPQISTTGLDLATRQDRLRLLGLFNSCEMPRPSSQKKRRVARRGSAPGHTLSKSKSTPGIHPMLPERPDNSEMTLRRFCRWRRIPLDDVQRTVIGVGLSKRAAERQIPVRKVKERLDSGFWSWGRVYPRAFLEEWLREYRAGLPGDQTAAPTSRSADNSLTSVPDSGLLAQ